MPDVRAAQGCQGISLLVDPATGNGMSITFWDSPANTQAYETSGGYQQQVAKVAPYFAGAPTMATYDVPVHA